MKKSLSVAGLALTILLSLNCGDRGLEVSPVGPAPIPTPTTEVPPPTFASTDVPLSANGPTLMQGSKRFDFRGAIICCTEPFAKRDGWPLVNERALDLFAEHGVNWTHIRTGPFTTEGEGLGFEGFVNGEVNPAFIDRVKDTISAARIRGIYVEVDLLDEWPIEHNLSPLSGGCGIFQRPPFGKVREWIEAIVTATRGFSNVTYQISNEAFDCDVRLAFELAVTQVVVRLAPGKMVFTNSHRLEIESSDFIDGVNRHQNFFLSRPSFNRPSIVNEYSHLSPEAFRANLAQARQAGTYFVAWRGDANEEEWMEMLQALRGK